MWTSAGKNKLTDWACEINGVLSPLNSIIQFWLSSKAVLKTSFSKSVKKSRCDTEPWFVVIVDQVSSSFFPWLSNISSKYLFLTLKDPDSVLWV